MSNLNTLFDFSKFEKRKPIEQKQFEKANAQLLRDFREFVPTCFEKLHKKVLANIEPIDQDRNLHAVVMNGFLKGQFIRKYPHLCYKATRQRFRLFVDNTNVFVKKLDEKTKFPSNIPTDQSLMIYNQLTDSTSDKHTNVFLGYTVREDWSKITGVYAVCIEGEEIIWISDLNTFGEEQSTTPVIPMGPTPIKPKVKPGVKKKKTKGDDNS
jgi:hypothetical protein